MHALRHLGLLALLLCPAGSALAASAPCDGSTLQMQACMSTQLDQADTRLAHYLAVAQARIDKDADGKPVLAAAQAAWTRYRDLQCGDVFELWAQGTYRTIAGAQCRLRLTGQRTHEVWQAYLTYQDSTPPLLPEPK